MSVFTCPSFPDAVTTCFYGDFRVGGPARGGEGDQHECVGGDEQGEPRLDAVGQRRVARDAAHHATVILSSSRCYSAIRSFVEVFV